MPEKSLLRMRYWDTYYYAQVVHNLLTHPISYLNHLEDFFGDQRYRAFLAPYPRWTALHKFIEHAFFGILDESIDDVMEDAIVNDREYEPWVTEALLVHGIDHIRIRPWMSQQRVALADLNEDTLHEYHSYLADIGALGTLATQVAEEVFFLLFVNRTLLRRLHEEIAERIREIDPATAVAEEAACFRRIGVLNRVPPPQWACRAVFHRDRGMCTTCHRDLSGLLDSERGVLRPHRAPRGGRHQRSHEPPTPLRRLQCEKGGGQPRGRSQL